MKILYITPSAQENIYHAAEHLAIAISQCVTPSRQRLMLPIQLDKFPAKIIEAMEDLTESDIKIPKDGDLPDMRYFR